MYESSESIHKVTKKELNLIYEYSAKLNRFEQFLEDYEYIFKDVHKSNLVFSFQVYEACQIYDDVVFDPRCTTPTNELISDYLQLISVQVSARHLHN